MQGVSINIISKEEKIMLVQSNKIIQLIEEARQNVVRFANSQMVYNLF